MTDFYGRLEEQLRAAGQHRQTQGRMGRAVAGRGRALVATTAVAAVLLAGGAVALSSSSTSEPAAPAPAPTPAPAPRPVPAGGSLAGIRVAVFNATAEPGLARATGAVLKSRRAHVAVFGSMTIQPGGRTVVWYEPGAAAQARRVAAVLGVPRVAPFDPSTGEAIPPPSARVTVIVAIGYQPRLPVATTATAPRAP
jgi:hypothetical protein